MEFQRWWVLKSKIFGLESTYSKDFFFKSVNELQFDKKCQNRTFKINFLRQKSTELKKKIIGEYQFRRQFLFKFFDQSINKMDLRKLLTFIIVTQKNKPVHTLLLWDSSIHFRLHSMVCTKTLRRISQP